MNGYVTVGDQNQMLPTLGFTGTRVGMTGAQQRMVHSVLSLYDWGEFHHGDCVGADAEADAMAAELRIPRIAHPPLADSQRAFCKGGTITFLARKPYLARDRDIVNATLGLLATPAEAEERLRSGTWATIRYARKMGKPVILVPPDGKVDWPGVWLASGDREVS